MTSPTTASCSRTAPPPRDAAKAGRAEAERTPRLNLTRRGWLASFLIVLLVVLLTPAVWKMMEKFATPPDYRIPYSLSKDYWLYQRRIDALKPGQIPVLGDSVVWGEYVARDGTLSHFLNQEAGEPDLYVNAGVNGLFPLALEGLVRRYGKAIHDRKVILHCNLLWMSSPESDLSTSKERKFNHARLVPQFTESIPCYRAAFNDRASIVVTREVPFLSWVGHIQNTYFDQKNLYAWTLADDGKYPPSFPNATKAPWKQITFEVPEEPEHDPDRGPESPRHKPWSTTGAGTQQFPWVPPGQSIQWRAFQRLVRLLRDRGNDVLVVIGPFNTHIMAPENRPAFAAELKAVRAWFDAESIPAVAPPVLESSLYGDSSHPLTEGYRQLAREIRNDRGFQAWQIETGQLR
jgi:hypothetical protein